MLHKLMLEIFIQTFFLYFIVIDPLGNTPLFLAVTQNMSSQQRVKTALSATIIASIILLFFAFLGSTLLSYLNISFSSVYDWWRYHFINNFYGNVV